MLDRAERGAAARVIAAAFRDNPLNRAVVRGGARRRLHANRAGAHAALASVPAGCCVLGAFRADVLEGVLMAAAPGAWPPPLPTPAAQLRCLLGQGLRTAQAWSRVHMALERLHPREPHWYLDVLGVTPARQRSGVGRALLRDFLARVDADGAASYLETDRFENVAFYRGSGFAVVGEDRVAGVPVWRLWRPAATH